MALYTLIYAGMTGLLLCSSVALLTAAFVDQFEIVVAITVFFSLFYIFFLIKFLRRFEPFQNQDTPKKIMGRISGMEKGYHPVQQSLQNPRREPQGVYDPAIEGFEDIQPEVPKEGNSQESSSAPNVRKEEVPAEKVEEVTSAVKKKSNEEIQKEEFESATNQLFKTGKMPSENKDGPMMDAGSTLMKAMESFKPEQVNAMTSSTKDLLEKQQNLMTMLKQMGPVLQDGKKLLDTFSGMFGGNGGAFTL
jgi:hypothetical protein